MFAMFQLDPVLPPGGGKSDPVLPPQITELSLREIRGRWKTGANVRARRA